MSNADSTSLTVTEFIIDEQFTLYCSKKAEKLVAAVYFVTDLLSDNEPMKWQMRDLAVQMLSSLQWGHSRIENENLVATTGSLLAMLQVAGSVRLLSKMNVDVLVQASKELQALFQEQKTKTNLSKDIFDVDDVSRRSAGEGDSLYETTTKGVNDINDTSFNKGHAHNESDEKGERAGISTENPVGKKQVSSVSSVEKRKEQIVDVVKVKGTATMSDIKKVIDSVSDKTLQRDLAALVSDNMLVKHGKKRWTKYSLV